MSVTFLSVDSWQSCVCFIRSGVTRCTLLMVIYLDRMCQYGYARCSGRTSVHLCTASIAAEPHSTAGLLFPSRCPSGTILLTAYSMVWDWRVSRAGPVLFYWPKMLYPFYNFLLFFPSLLSVYRFSLWGLGLRTDRVYTVYHSLSALHCRPFLIIIISIYFNFVRCWDPL